MWNKMYYFYQEKKLKWVLIGRSTGRKYLIPEKGVFDLTSRGIVELFFRQLKLNKFIPSVPS